jgi:hypothetical protein
VTTDVIGIQCELFVADPVDAPHYEDGFDDDAATDKFEVVPLGGLTQLQFEMLWAITEGRPWRATTHAFEWVGDPPDVQAETWLFRFPPAFVTRLAKLTDTEVAAITDQWARTEEIACPPEEIEPVVSSLVELARSAEGSSRGLYLWGSL